MTHEVEWVDVLESGGPGGGHVEEVAPPSGTRWWALVLLAVIAIGVVWALWPSGHAADAPDPEKVRTLAELRMCKRNLELLNCAMKKYVRDIHGGIWDHVVFDEALGRKLVADGYLTILPDDPGCGPHTFSHYQAENFEIHCIEHGSLAEITEALKIRP